MNFIDRNELAWVLFLGALNAAWAAFHFNQRSFWACFLYIVNFVVTENEGGTRGKFIMNSETLKEVKGLHILKFEVDWHIMKLKVKTCL